VNFRKINRSTRCQVRCGKKYQNIQVQCYCKLQILPRMR
jgi:hypothetical protein